jgi:hypothetical protein
LALAAPPEDAKSAKNRQKRAFDFARVCVELKNRRPVFSQANEDE